jgi:itaconyl-CoA hydratase
METTEIGSYLDDYTVGDVYEHPRGRTVGQTDNMLATHLSLNTAQVHFNLEAARELLDGAFADFLVMGGYTMSLVIGLTSEDMSETAVADVGIDDLRFPNPVYPGDTIFARSEVLAVESSGDPEAGVLSYRFTGYKSDGKVVVEGIRHVLVRWRAGAGLNGRGAA